MITNCELYKYGIVHGFLPKKVNAILKSLEKDNKITVKPKIPTTRKKGSFYIDYKEKPKIEIFFEGKG
jgi:hypothetical protein